MMSGFQTVPDTMLCQEQSRHRSVHVDQEARHEVIWELRNTCNDVIMRVTQQ